MPTYSVAARLKLLEQTLDLKGNVDAAKLAQCTIKQLQEKAKS